MGGYKGAAPSSAPTSTAAPAPPPKPTVGSMLAGLAAPTGADGKGPSQIQQAGQAAGGGGQQSQPAAPQPDLQGQQAAAMIGAGASAAGRGAGAADGGGDSGSRPAAIDMELGAARGWDSARARVSRFLARPSIRLEQCDG